MPSVEGQQHFEASDTVQAQKSQSQTPETHGRNIVEDGAEHHDDDRQEEIKARKSRARQIE